MTSAAPPSTNSDSSPAEDSPRPSDGLGRRNRRQRRSVWNFSNLTAFQVLLRSGWIFKTESIIMPAVVDAIGGSAAWRGFLPLLNRFGQSIPPLLVSQRLARSRRKKMTLVATVAMMALCFAILAVCWSQPHWRGAPWFLAFYLTLYGVFFVATGIMQLCFGTLQGKLVPVARRGRLMLAANLIGATSAILLACWLLPAALRAGAPGFTLIFAVSAICFAAAAVAAAWLREPKDRPHADPAAVGGHHRRFVESWLVVRSDANFRRLAGVAALFGVSIMLFPHYQSLGLQRMELDLSELFWWVVIQNAGTAAFSLVVGPMADRRGNRLVLRCLLVGIAVAPLWALGLTYLGAAGRLGFSSVFLLVGMTPITMRVFNNYTLEIAPPRQHPKYLATLGLCLAVPILVSPLIGGCIDWFGFEPVFCGVSLMVLAAWWQSRNLLEPRHGPVRSMEIDEPPQV